VLGHHRIGDYFWYSAFENPSFFDYFDVNGDLKQGCELRTHEALMAVITYIHESYHLVQDLTVGLAAWAQYSADDLAMTIHEIAQQLPHSPKNWPLSNMPGFKGSSHFRAVTSLLRQESFIHDCIYSSKMTDAVLDAELAAHPDLRDSPLNAGRGLTGQDLLECHAEILTERYLCGLVQKYPSAFDPDLLFDLRGCCRVEEMPPGQKLLALSASFLPFMKFGAGNRQHPLYPACSRPAEYGFILFLIDYALHLCPLRPTDSPLMPDIQDAIPTVRMLKLLGSVFPCLMQPEVKENFVLHEQYLYGEFMPRLASFNNRCNSEMHRAPSFYTYGEITRGWQELTARMLKRATAQGLLPLFELGQKYRLKGLEIVFRNPTQVYASNIVDFAMGVGFNPMIGTNSRMGLALPYVLGPSEHPDGRYEIPPSPIEAMDTFVAREIFLKLSTVIFTGDVFECPVESRLAFYPCPRRGGACKSIDRPRNIPLCFARQVLQDFYPQYANA
jgi:hypothetical protein